MPDWTAPFHLPRFTDDKFEAQKDAYNAKHGYVVTLPAWDDIIHITTPRPMSPGETNAWKKREYNKFTDERLAEIRRYKEKKRQKYLDMLGSPSPRIVRAAGALLTSLDDMQDAVSTLACIGLITSVVIGGTTAAVLTGPLGWIVGLSTLLSLINPYSRLRGRKGKPLTGRKAKKELEDLTDRNPFSKKARLRVATNIKRFRPHLGNYLEALQVTDQIFGIGICLGPIIGSAQDLVAGGIRSLAGQKVVVKGPPPLFPDHIKVAQKALRSQAVMHGAVWESDFDDEVATMLAANLSIQVVEPYLVDWNPFVEIDDVSSTQISAPRPTDILTLEIIEESGRTIDEVCNWPQTGERWINMADLEQQTSAQATQNLNHFAEQNANSPLAFIAGQNAHDFALRTLLAVEGAESLVIQYSMIERIVIIILDNGWCYPDDITETQIDKFEEWCYVHEYMQTCPSAKEIWQFTEIFCGFTWASSEDETR